MFLSSTVHNYAVNPEELAAGGDGVTLEIDEEGDGIIDKVVFSGTELTDTDVEFPAITFLPPLQKKLQIFLSGQAVPVKFQLFDENDEIIADASTSLSFASITDGSVGEFQPAASKGKANQENQFRFDEEDQHYIFSWNTKELKSGEYRLRIDVNNEIQHFITVELKKEVRLAALIVLLDELSAALTGLLNTLKNFPQA